MEDNEQLEINNEENSSKQLDKKTTKKRVVKKKVAKKRVSKKTKTTTQDDANSDNDNALALQETLDFQSDAENYQNDNQSQFIDEKIPEYFSTTDEDLIQDNYNDYSSNDNSYCENENEHKNISANDTQKNDTQDNSPKQEQDLKENNEHLQSQDQDLSDNNEPVANWQNDKNQNSSNNRNNNFSSQNNRQNNKNQNSSNNRNKNNRSNNQQNNKNQNSSNNRNNNFSSQNNRQNNKNQNSSNNRNNNSSLQNNRLNKNNNQQNKQRKKYTPNENSEPFFVEFVDAVNPFNTIEAINEKFAQTFPDFTDELFFDFHELYQTPLNELQELANIENSNFVKSKVKLISSILKEKQQSNLAIKISGVLDIQEDGSGILVYEKDCYAIKALSAFVPKALVKNLALQNGHFIEAFAICPSEISSCPIVLKVISLMGKTIEQIASLEPFTDLIPYYPTQRIFLETSPKSPWSNASMRTIDLLTPIGLGQRGLIVAPPRTGKTVIMQAMANSIAKNVPDAELIILLIDERPEEVTDFKRQLVGKAKIISSTFDENAQSHVHAAQMVIDNARRMVENGQDVIILLDSITRLARAYNTVMPSSGKILSGGVEANALELPKRFFGSARNIENGGSLTILATALVETGSKMDEVIFEEFKGTGNMELHLDRDLVNKRIFPAINFEKSGTRKEELLYDKDEMLKIHSLRKSALKDGNISSSIMEMIIKKVKNTKTNVEFLVGINT